MSEICSEKGQPGSPGLYLKFYCVIYTPACSLAGLLENGNRVKKYLFQL